MLVISGTTVCYLVPGCDYIIGRKSDCDVVVQADVKYGISRRHGKISYHVNEEVLFTDTSQFGSYVNDQKVEPNQTVQLDAGSTLRLGQHPASWKIEKMKITISNLQGPIKGKIVSSVKRLKLPFSGSWDKSCTTLIMSTISVTVKVILAVTHCRTILTPAFISDIEAAIRNKSKLKPLDSYTPPIADLNLKTVKFFPNIARCNLFEGLKFVFMTESEKNESEEIVKSLDGTTVLLDPLHKDRKSIILSADSIVMETKDATLSSYLRQTLSDRGLLPTKHADIALALFYIDKNRLFKRSNESSQASSFRVQDTQAMSQMTFTDPDSIDVSKVGNVSVFEPSEVPQKLDKTIKTENDSTVLTKSTGCSSKPGSTPSKDISFFEPSAVPPRLDKTISTPVSDKSKINTNKDISFFEPSAVPPRLDKTISTPVSAKSKVNTNKDISFFEPSAVPPRLDTTITTPPSSSSPTTNTTKSSGSVKDRSFYEPSAVPPRLDKTSPMTSFVELSVIPPKLEGTPSRTPAPTGFKRPLTINPATPSPMTDSKFSSTSLFSSSKPSCVQSAMLSTSRDSMGSECLFERSTSVPNTTSRTPLRTQNKRPLFSNSSDEDSDEDDNPFAKSSHSRPSLLANTLISLQRKVEESAKKQRLLSPEEPTVTPAPAKTSPTPELTITRVCDSPPASSTPCVKRELADKMEPVNKKVRLSDENQADSSPIYETEAKSNGVHGVPAKFSENSTFSEPKAVSQIPDMSQNIWFKRSDVIKADLDRPFASLVITDISVNLVADRPESDQLSSTRCSGNLTVNSNGVPNFKRFKKRGIVTRSMDVSLKNGEFRQTASARSFFDSQSQTIEHEEEEEVSVFAKFGDFRGM